MNRRAEQGRTTRQRLVEVATELFARHGFEGTSIEAVLKTAGVSRGSLYHHFAGKDALFESVLLAVEARIGAEINAAAAAAEVNTSRDALRVGCLTWVRLAGDPVVQRIVLIDAPSVLGWNRWREIEEDAPLGMIKAVMAVAAEEGRLDPGLVEVYSHLVLATMNELALFVARAEHVTAAQRIAEAAVDDYLSRLLPDSGPPKPTSSRRGMTSGAAGP